MSNRRVVVTGIGVVSPLGKNVNDTWEGIINNKSGLGRLTRFPIDDLPDSVSKVVGEVNMDLEDPKAFHPEDFIEKKELKKMDIFVLFGIGAAAEAIEDSGWKPETEEEKERTGVIVGSGIGGLPAIQSTAETFIEKGIKKITPFFIPQALINITSGHISMKYGFTGPNLSVVTACASSTHSIGEAFEIIKRSDADVMIAGGSESSICEIGMGGFNSMHALSTNFNDTPEKSSRPWDKDRCGFVMGEGAGMLVLEEYEHAKARGAKIYAEVVGYGLSGDAYHITAPHENGEGAKRSMKMALKKAGISTDKIDYINAHGTSTPMGDTIEFNAVKEIFKDNLDKISMSSTKSAIGHLLGAAGAVEAIFCIKAMQDSILPPTLNLENQDEKCTGIDLVPLKSKKKNIEYSLSNSFGFGGTNASVILKKI